MNNLKESWANVAWCTPAHCASTCRGLGRCAEPQRWQRGLSLYAVPPERERQGELPDDERTDQTPLVLLRRSSAMLPVSDRPRLSVGNSSIPSIATRHNTAGVDRARREPEGPEQAYARRVRAGRQPRNQQLAQLARRRRLVLSSNNNSVSQFATLRSNFGMDLFF